MHEADGSGDCRPEGPQQSPLLLCCGCRFSAACAALAFLRCGCSVSSARGTARSLRHPPASPFYSPAVLRRSRDGPHVSSCSADGAQCAARLSTPCGPSSPFSCWSREACSLHGAYFTTSNAVGHIHFWPSTESRCGCATSFHAAHHIPCGPATAYTRLPLRSHISRSPHGPTSYPAATTAAAHGSVRGRSGNTACHTLCSDHSRNSSGSFCSSYGWLRLCRSIASTGGYGAIGSSTGRDAPCAPSGGAAAIVCSTGRDASFPLSGGVSAIGNTGKDVPCAPSGGAAAATAGGGAVSLSEGIAAAIRRATPQALLSME